MWAPSKDFKNGQLDVEAQPSLAGAQHSHDAGVEMSTASFTGRGSSRDAMLANNQLDERFELPGTAAKSSDWKAVAFHTITAIVGAGVLGLPYAMKFLLWPGGAIVMALSWITSLYTLWQLCMMHEMDGLRFNRYHELAQYAFGPKLGIWLVVPFQVTVMAGLAIVYMITGGSSMLRVWQLYGPPDTSFGLSAWILVFFGLQLILSQVPNFNQLKAISFLAAIMSLGYSTIAIAVTIANGRQPNSSYNLDGFSVPAGIFGAFTAFGTIAFAYGGHNVTLEIQATMPSPPSTFKPYMRGVYFSYAVISWCYLGVAFSGYWAFGQSVDENILFSLQHPRGVIALAAMMVLVHVTGSYQVYSMPLYDMIETVMVRRGISNGFVSRLIYRSIYTCLTTFVAITLPFFSDLLGFIGASAFGPTTFVLPAVMWLILKEPRRWGGHWAASWTCIIFGVITTVLGTIGGLRSIIVKADSYRFYA